MCKIKTIKAIRKRFRMSSGGKLFSKPASIRHRLTSKNGDRNRRCFSFTQVDATDFYRLRKYIKYYTK